MTTTTGITPIHRALVAEQLSILLADEFLIYVKTLNAHWNVEGPDFYNKHLFFEDQYKQLAAIIDDLAERIRSLGHYAPATMAEFLRLTHFTEKSREHNNSIGFIRSLLLDHDDLIMHLRASIYELQEKLKDNGTSDHITSLMEMHEKMAWMLRAHL